MTAPTVQRPPSGIDLYLAGELDTYLAEDQRLSRLIPERSSKGHLLWLRSDGGRTP